MKGQNIDPFYDPEKAMPMNVVAFMSGSGSNVEKVLEHQKRAEERGIPPYRIVAVFTDEPSSQKCNYKNIAGDYSLLPLEHGSIDDFYVKRGYPDKKSAGREEKLRLRKEFDEETLRLLRDFTKDYGVDIHCLMLGGYMSFLTSPVIDNYLTVNVHPADLRIRTDDGRRKYTGDNAVRDEIAAGESEIRSTVHVAAEKVDYGPMLMVSGPLAVDHQGLSLEQLRNSPQKLEEVADYNQNRLKEAGDWVIFPKTLDYIAEGRFGQDREGNVFHRNEKGGWAEGPIVLD